MAIKPEPGMPENRGFTFTLSIVLLSVTLIAMAVFSREWRASQQSSFTALLPSEAQVIDERVASDFGKMFGAQASVEEDNQTTASIGVTVLMPFMAEGLPLAPVNAYSQSLAYSLRAAGYEAVLATNSISGSNATVMLFPGNGTLEESNGGAYDTAAYYQPQGANPSAIYVTIVCNKTASDVGELSIISENQSGSGYYYRINYTESSSGKTYLADCDSPPASNTSLTIFYPDLSQIFIESSFSPSNSRNWTAVSYTKSPGGYLILPFDLNGSLRDYSLFENNLSFGSSAPTWADEDCESGGCLQFNASDGQYISGQMDLFDSEIPATLGVERVSNGAFQYYNSTTNSWYSWQLADPDPNVVFTAANDSLTGYGIGISDPNPPAGDNHASQTIRHLYENSPYALSFQSEGSGGYYQVIDATTSQYLQPDGSWGGPSDLPVNASAAFQQVSAQFTLPIGSSAVTIELIPNAAGGSTHYDSVSLKQITGQNGGFESWYYDTGPGGTGFVPEVDKG